jgi:hypothetical protein
MTAIVLANPLRSPRYQRSATAAERRRRHPRRRRDDGRRVSEYRWAEGRNDRLSELVAELVHRQVTIIVVLETTNGALAAKSVTQTIPIVFMHG